MAGKRLACVQFSLMDGNPVIIFVAEGIILSLIRVIEIKNHGGGTAPGVHRFDVPAQGYLPPPLQQKTEYKILIRNYIKNITHFTIKWSDIKKNICYYVRLLCDNVMKIKVII